MELQRAVEGQGQGRGHGIDAAEPVAEQLTQLVAERRVRIEPLQALLR